jgi:hypothetical protein
MARAIETVASPGMVRGSDLRTQGGSLHSESNRDGNAVLADWEDHP